MSSFSQRVRLYTDPSTPGRVLVGAKITFTTVADDPAVLTLTVPQVIAGELEGGFYAAVEHRNSSGRWVSPPNNLHVFRKKAKNEKDPTRLADFTGVLYVADRLGGHLIDSSITIEGEVSWLAASAGAVMADAMTRVPGHGVTRSFTPAVDSNGVAWPADDIDDKSAALWTPLGSVLTTMATAGYCSWHARGRELRLLVPGPGVTHELPIGPGAESVQVEEDLTDTASIFHIVTDTDVAEQVITRPELGLGPRHAVITVAGASTATQARKMAKPLIDAASRVRRSTVVTYDAANLPGLPFIDFQIGDNFTVNGEVLRLVGIQVSTDDTTTVQLTFGEVFYTLAAKLAARTASLSLGSGSATVGRPMPATTPEPAQKPGRPTAPAVESELAQVWASWNGMLVTGKPGKTVRGVVAEAAAAPTGPWKYVGDEFAKKTPFAAAAVPVAIDGTVYVRLRAVNTKGVLSDPSDVASVIVRGIKGPDIDGAVTGAINAAAVAAANAQSTADGKITISPFTPTAADGAGKPTGALWWRKGAFGTVIGLWEWSGAPSGAWVPRPFDESFVPQINIGTGTYGELKGVRLEADSVSVTKLLVGNYSNLLDNPQFSQGLTGWNPSSPGWSVADVGGTWRNTARVVVTEAWTTCQNARLACNPGDTFRIAAGIHDPLAGSGGSARVGVYFRDADGNDLSSQWATQTVANSWSVVAADVTAPAGAKTVQFMFNVTGRTAGTVTFGLPTFSRKVDAALIVDGAVKARHVDTEELWADAGFFNTAKANVLGVGALTGITITGSVVRSAPSGQRVQLDTVGLRAYNAANALVASLSASTGGLTLNGPLTTAASGARSVLNEWRLKFYDGDGADAGYVGLSSAASGNLLRLSTANSANFLEIGAGYNRFKGSFVVSEATGFGGRPYFLVLEGTSNRMQLVGGGFAAGYQSEVWLGADSTSGRVASYTVYNREYTNSANMFITSEGTLGRSTSLKAAKLDVEDQTITDPLAILNIPARAWIDRGSVERAVAEGYDDPSKRIRAFGAVVEEVAPHAPYLVTTDGDGNANGLAYDRFGVALIPTLRWLVEQIAELKGQPAPTWPESPVYDDTAAWAAITGGTA